VLLGAVNGFVSAHDEELRRCFENLLVSAVTGQSDTQAHPAFMGILKEMNPLNARVVRTFATSGYFESSEALVEALNVTVDSHAIDIAMANLHRLEVVYYQDPYSSAVRSFSPEPTRTQCGPGVIWLVRTEQAVVTEDNGPKEVEIKRGRLYHLTELGAEFLSVIYPDLAGA
jgi:hypothetical protein